MFGARRRINPPVEQEAQKSSVVFGLAARGALTQTDRDPRFARHPRLRPCGRRPHPGIKGRPVRGDVDELRPAPGIRFVKVAVDAGERPAFLVQHRPVVVANSTEPSSRGNVCQLLVTRESDDRGDEKQTQGRAVSFARVWQRRLLI